MGTINGGDIGGGPGAGALVKKEEVIFNNFLWAKFDKIVKNPLRSSPVRVAILAVHYSLFFILATSFSLHTPAEHLF